MKILLISLVITLIIFFVGAIFQLVIDRIKDKFFLDLI